ncbi:MAG: B12-binding domain-containing radical SAM protein [bacterium]
MHKFVMIDPGFLGEYGMGKWGCAYWSSAINHGVAQISAVCKEEGIDFSLIDFRRVTSYDHFADIIGTQESPWYGITCRTVDVPIAEKAAAIIKEKKPECKIIVGGIHPSIYPDDFLKNPTIDYVFAGEADVTLPLLIKEPGRFSKHVKGDVPDIDESPFEDLEVYDYKTSISFSLYGGIVKPPMVPLITSRGCVYNCKFCQPAERILYGKKYRQKKVSRVLEGVDYIASCFDFNSIMLYDDCILAHKDFLYPLLHELAKKRKTEIMLQGRADNICQLGDEIAEFKKLGLAAVIVGFESGSQRILDFIGKRTTVEDNNNAGELLHKHNIKIVGNFMIGLPTETCDEMRQTVNMAQRIKPTIASCSFYSPMPGSYIYDYCKENDLIIEKSFAKLSRDPTTPKIKGVDYHYAAKALYEITGSRFKNPLVRKLVGYAYKNLKRGPVREKLTRIYNRVVR